MSAQGRLERVLQVHTHLPPYGFFYEQGSVLCHPPDVSTKSRMPTVYINCWILQSILVAEDLNTFQALGQSFGVSTLIQLDHQPDFVGRISMAKCVVV
jgi:hypothetical protein